MGIPPECPEHRRSSLSSLSEAGSSVMSALRKELEIEDHNVGDVEMKDSGIDGEDTLEEQGQAESELHQITNRYSTSWRDVLRPRAEQPAPTIMRKKFAAKILAEKLEENNQWCKVADESVYTVDGDVEADEQTVLQNKIINEEYKIWKKNAVYLYDIMFALVSWCERVY